MKTEQLQWLQQTGWSSPESLMNGQAALVFAFGGIDVIGNPEVYAELHKRYSNANIVMASTAGEIHGNSVSDGSISVTACNFDYTATEIMSLKVDDFADSYACGEAIAADLLKDDLKHILVFSDGTSVNGDELVKGINQGLPKQVIVTGGLAGDAGRFNGTRVGVNAVPVGNNIVAIGFYGDRFHVAHGSQGGWDAFGPIRKVTKSNGNVLMELDGENALAVYKKYLGTRASELPGAALLFPLCIHGDDGSRLVRTILTIDEQTGSMNFAGNIPIDANVQFMMANFDRLVDGAAGAAEQSVAMTRKAKPDLVMMVSCVGRKIVLGQRIDEEVESVCNIFGEGPAYTGFYSNGEISPLLNSVGCSLHNQTMTITTYKEE
ncbi:MAG: FIST signal transduction protein [Flavobacteriales bacterium]